MNAKVAANRPLRAGLMILSVAALLAGMWAGLIRIGWGLPPLQPPDARVAVTWGKAPKEVCPQEMRPVPPKHWHDAMAAPSPVGEADAARPVMCA